MSKWQDLNRLAHYLAHNDCYEVAGFIFVEKRFMRNTQHCLGAVLQLKIHNKVLMKSLKIRIQFYTLRIFCGDPLFNLTNDSCQKFYSKFEKLVLQI
jgi:hypothetical protein